MELTKAIIRNLTRAVIICFILGVVGFLWWSLGDVLYRDFGLGGFLSYIVPPFILFIFVGLLILLSWVFEGKIDEGDNKTE